MFSNKQMLVLGLLFCIVGVHGITREARGGRWSDKDNWCPTGVPEKGDDVVIDVGVDMLFDAQTPRLGVVKVDGALRFDLGTGAADTELRLIARTILAPIARPVHVILINDQTPIGRAEDLTERLFIAPYGAKMLAVHQRGVWEAHGVGRTPTWTRLTEHAVKGSNKLTLEHENDWKVGDRLIVTSTDFSGDQTEVRTITATSDGGKALTLDMPLTFSHHGKNYKKHGFDVIMRAEVGVLTSNFKISGEMEESPELIEPQYVDYDLKFGGHTIGVDLSVQRLEGIEFFNMGQKGRLARYPVHWHHVRDAPGQYIKRCSIYNSFSRAVTVHDTNMLRVEQIVAFNVTGHSMYLEDGTEVLNQFVDNLAVTSIPVGIGSNDYKSGAFLFPGCTDGAGPGVRLQFLDHEPSGFWITNVNNTFLGNVAVGHTWGFWIRVDLVFNEPAFANAGCTVCRAECKITGQASLPTIRGSGLVWHTNVAHSNSRSGIWIKENWVPFKPEELKQGYHWQDDINVMTGMIAYKNHIGIDNYGVGAVWYDHAYALDNGLQFQTEWVRRGMHKISNSLFVGETENHGNPGASGVRSTKCSVIFPESERTVTSLGGLPTAMIRMADNGMTLDNVVFADARLRCDQTAMPFSFNEYHGYALGVLQHPNKGGPVSAGRQIGAHFDNVYFTKPGAPLYARDKTLYGSGFKDVLGTMPCSEPGAYFLYNTPAAVADNCEYRSNWDMFYCPPFEGDYVQLTTTFRRQYQTVAAGMPSLLWECGKRLASHQTSPGTSHRFSVRTDKLYTMEFENDYVPTGIQVVPTLDTVTHPELFDGWAGPEIAFRFKGNWDVSYYRRFSTLASFENWEELDKPTTVCQCGYTYVKVRLTSARGNELRMDAGSGACPATPCANPYEAPAPVGYNCGDKPTSDDKDFNTAKCPYKTVPTAPAMPPMPTLAEFALPASVTLRAAHDGTEKCHGRKTATCAGGDNCQAPKQAPSPMPAATPPPDNGLTKCERDADCAALTGGAFECYAKNCVRRTVVCTAGDNGCKCVPDVDAELQCNTAGYSCVDGACVFAKAGQTPSEPGATEAPISVDDPLYKPVTGDGTDTDIGCVRGNGGCLCTIQHQCAGSTLSCNASGFCVEVGDCAGEIGCSCIRQQCLGGQLVCALLGERDICVKKSVAETTPEPSLVTASSQPVLALSLWLTALLLACNQ